MILDTVSLKNDTRPRKVTYLAPNMRRVFVHQGLSRIAVKKLGNDEEADILFTVEGLLKDMATVTVCGKVDNTTPARR